jgi:spore germination cell wall hydrolase CwlJ-like protein
LQNNGRKILRNKTNVIKNILLIVMFAFIIFAAYQLNTYEIKYSQLQKTQKEMVQKIEERERRVTDLSNAYEEVRVQLGEKNNLIDSLQKRTFQKTNSYQKSNISSRSGFVRSGIILENNIKPTHLVNEIKVTNEEFNLLCKVIYAEATETTENKELDNLLVGNVILNRILDERLGNSIKSVIYRKGQYACLTSSKFKQEPSELAINSAKRLLAGERFCPTNVIWQSQSIQGKIFKKVGKHYYCY